MAGMREKKICEKKKKQTLQARLLPIWMLSHDIVHCIVTSKVGRQRTGGAPRHDTAGHDTTTARPRYDQAACDTARSARLGAGWRYKDLYRG